MKVVFVNGKFAAQAMTGVQRSAAHTVAALDRLLADAPAGAPRWVLLCPRGAVAPTLRHIELREVGPAVPLHLWEQAVLPWAARGAMLLNLAGSAPYAKRLQVCTIHDAAVFDFPQAYSRAFGAWYRFLFRHLARSTQTLLTVSEFSKSRLAATLGVPAQRIAVMHGSGEHMRQVQPDLGVLQRLGLDEGGYFIAVGSANLTKNHAALIEAFGSLGGMCPARLVVVGGSNDAVFRSGATAPHGERIVRTGRLSDAELKALYASALALLFPSVYEGFGLPLLEAMTCGCAVAAARVASIPEVCGEAALYFDPHSQAELRAAILRLANEPALRASLRERGAQRAQAFSWTQAARVLLAQFGGAEAVVQAAQAAR